jgi:hypothetical protein
MVPLAATDAELIALVDQWAALLEREEVDRWKPNPRGEVGEIWYDLNIDGVASDLTATFRIVRVPGGLELRLNDVHVM